MRMGNLERNTYVREQITKAMIKLLKKKEMKQITIGDITEMGEVSRVSFYRNYEDKEDIIKTYIGKMILDWQKAHPGFEGEDKRSKDDQMLGSLFGMLKEHSDFYGLLNKRGILYLLRDTLKEIYGPKPEYPNIGAYVAAFMFSGIYGWIEEWISRGMQESADEMIMLLKQRQI